jgi:hypothetical protein
MPSGLIKIEGKFIPAYLSRRLWTTNLGRQVNKDFSSTERQRSSEDGGRADRGQDNFLVLGWETVFKGG